MMVEPSLSPKDIPRKVKRLCEVNGGMISVPQAVDLNHVAVSLKGPGRGTESLKPARLDLNAKLFRVSSLKKTNRCSCVNLRLKPNEFTGIVKFDRYLDPSRRWGIRVAGRKV